MQSSVRVLNIYNLFVFMFVNMPMCLEQLKLLVRMENSGKKATLVVFYILTTIHATEKIQTRQFLTNIDTFNKT